LSSSAFIGVILNIRKAGLSLILSKNSHTSTLKHGEFFSRYLLLHPHHMLIDFLKGMLQVVLNLVSELGRSEVVWHKPPICLFHEDGEVDGSSVIIQMRPHIEDSFLKLQAKIRWRILVLINFADEMDHCIWIGIRFMFERRLLLDVGLLSEEFCCLLFVILKLAQQIASLHKYNL